MRDHHKTILSVAFILCSLLLAFFSYKNLFSSASPRAVSAEEHKPTALAESEPTTNLVKPTRRIKEIGRSNGNRLITSFIYGGGKACVLILAGIHGDEPSSVLFAKELDLSLQEDAIPANLTIVIVPIANPDGLISQTRLNTRGVDINRNFPTRSWKANVIKNRYNPGEKPASEPETRAIVDLIEEFQPKLLISIHAPLACINWDGPAEEVSAIISELSGYSLKREIGYETPGSLGQYAGIERRIPTVTFELRFSETHEQMRENVRSLKAAFLYISRYSH